jgi:two-component system, NarL family, nitrate/nitrite response regulator NarL
MVRVLVISEVLLICNIVASMLKEEQDIKVVGCVTTLKEAMAKIDRCDIALIGATIPNKETLQFVRKLTKADSSARVVVMGLPESEEVIVEYIEAGITGYVLHDESTDELVDKIRAVAKGEALVSPNVVTALMERIVKLKEMCDDKENDAELSDLTPREREVLDLLEQSLSNQEIARRLVIEVGTVKNHVHNILKKLDLNSRRDLTVRNSVKNA